MTTCYICKNEIREDEAYCLPPFNGCFKLAHSECFANYDGDYTTIEDEWMDKTVENTENKTLKVNDLKEHNHIIALYGPYYTLVRREDDSLIWVDFLSGNYIHASDGSVSMAVAHIMSHGGKVFAGKDSQDVKQWIVSRFAK